MKGKSSVLVLGGTSGIGFAVARAYAAQGWNVVLAGRDANGLERNRRDLATRFDVRVGVALFDICDTARQPAFLDGLGALPETVVCVVGVMTDQHESERDLQATMTMMRSNYEGPALLLGEIANRMEARGSGTIVGVSSVAGDRGRATNYTYGSAKAGFTTFLSGLRNRLARRGVRVVTVKPGFVRTRMTEGLKLPGPLTADPEEVGRAIYRAAEVSKRDVIYVRPIWRIVMAAIGGIPEALFKRMRI